MDIKEGDIILNHFAADLWLVDYVDNELKLCLIPNSGYFGHPDDEYPAYIEDLDIAEDSENWEKIGNKYDNPNLLEGLNYSN
jgi:hypothetical protein